MSENDDVSTIVLDFGKLKSKLDEKENILEEGNLADELSFTHDAQSIKESSTALHALKLKRKIILVEFKTDYFQRQKALFNELNNISSVSDLNELNKSIIDFPNALFIMYFNDTPKAINQISEQLKRKFDKADTIIIAKNLSKEKALMHQKSKYGANAYLSEPFSPEDLEKTLEPYLE